ncbi:MAG: glycosyltransferase family 4 protein [Puniceicoccaceae bacterium]
MASLHGQFSVEGLHPTGLEAPGCWMRERATVRFRCRTPVQSVRILADLAPVETQCHSRWNRQPPGLELRLDAGTWHKINPTGVGELDQTCAFSSGREQDLHVLEVRLKRVFWTNFLAFTGRKLERAFWLPKRWRQWLQPFRRQWNNRRLRIRSVWVNGDCLLDLERSHASFESEFLFRNADLGINVVGWFHGYLGVGESARACVRAAETTGLPVHAVNLRLHLEGGQSPELWTKPLVDQGMQAISIAHVDAPQSFDLTVKHPVEMGKDRYRIGYWAWELPEFPDAWVRYALAFDEIWCPSDFCREAMAAKLPIPVMTMPHAIEIPEVEGTPAQWRRRFGLPKDRFLFLFSFDLNSYAPRKNPEAVIEAYRLAFAESCGDASVGLVLKMHGKGYRPEDRLALQKLQQELPHLYIVDETLTREALTGLQFACDAFVSLHRSEGFGLAVAEMMALGKPVISTNWSATSEFVDLKNGCPVAYQLVELERPVGPYSKGQLWAEADTHDAARWMRKVAEDSDFRTRIATAGMATMRDRFSIHVIGERYRRRIKAISLFHHTSN